MAKLLSYKLDRPRRQILRRRSIWRNIIKVSKEKVRPSANAKSDIFLREAIALNVMSLWKSKEMLAQATGATRHGNCYSDVDSRSDVNFMVKLIRETDVFKT